MMLSIMQRFVEKLSLIIILCSSINFVQGSAQCVMYDVCGKNPLTHADLYCQYNGPSKPLMNETVLNILKDLCPSLNLGPNNDTCCTEKAVLDLQENMKMIQNLFGRCPSCHQNIATVFCDSICSNNQSDFLMVTKTVKSTFYPGKMSVEEVSYFINEDYVHGLYDSCKEVRSSYTNETAMTLICGKSGCSPYNFLNYFGTTDMSQVQFNFQFERSGNISVNGSIFSPMNDPFYKCDEAPNGKHPCFYVDCPGCPPSYPSQKHFPIQTTPVFIASLIVYLALLSISIFIYFMKTVPEDEMSGNDDEHRPLINRCEESVTDMYLTTFLFGNISQLIFVKFVIFCSKLKGRLILLLLFLTISVSCMCGFFLYNLTNNNPIYLWSSSKSLLQKEKNYFNEHFESLQRKEQIIIIPTIENKSTVNNSTYSKVFDREFLQRVLDLQSCITKLEVGENNTVIHFEDICYSQSNNGKCVINSVLNWFQNNASHLNYYDDNAYLLYLQNCIKNPLFMQKEGLSCLGDFGGPIYPYLVLGGVSDKNYENASALIITFLLKNDNNNNISDVIAWEKKFLKFIDKFNDSSMNVSYYSEQLIEDEFNSISPFVLFYITFALCVLLMGLLVYSLFSRMSTFLCLGFSVLCVSHISSMGIFSYFGIPSSIFSQFAVAHLIYYIGMGNIFFIIHLLYKYPKHDHEVIEEYVIRLLSKLYFPFLLVTLSQIVSCVTAGIFLNSPITATFCYVSALALVIFFFMIVQYSCIQFFPLVLNATIPENESRISKACINLLKRDDKACEYIVNFLMNTKMRLFLAFIFVNTFSLSIIASYEIEIGLDQKLMLPKNSHLLQFHNDFEQYSSVGPPVYFVIPSKYNYNNVQNQNVLCNFPYCYRDSLVAQITSASKQPNVTYITEPPLDWLDGYFAWANDGVNCCRVYFNDSTTLCPPTERALFCRPCNIVNPETYHPRPDKFYSFLEKFLEEDPSESCPSAGHFVFDNSVEIIKDEVSNVGATYFLSYHTNLKTPSDHINAQKFAREISNNISQAFGLHNVSNSDRIFPYSPDYIFYEQQISMWDNTVIALAVAITVIFAVTVLLTKFNFHYAVFLVINVIIVVVQIFGVMYLWNIPLNELTLAILIITISIPVEYCVHVTNAFASSLRLKRTNKVSDAFFHTGTYVFYSFVFRFLSTIPLYYTAIPLFSVIFYRFYWTVNIVNIFHTYFFLPVLLSIFGPSFKNRGNNVTDILINDDNN